MPKELLKLVRGSAFVFACRLAGALLVFVTQIYLARWMGATELGIYVFAFSLCTLLSIVTGLGYPATALPVIGRHLADEEPDYIRGFIRQGSLIVAAVSAIAGLLGAALISIFHEQLPDGYATPMMIVMICIPVFSLLRMNLRIAHAMSWFQLAFLPNMVLRPLLFIIITYLAWRTGSQLSADTTMWLQFLAMCLVAIGQFAITRRMLNRELRAAQPRYETRLWLRMSAPLLLVTLFTQFFPEISVTLMGTMLPAHDVAIYNASYRTALFIAFGLAAVGAFMTPRISRLYAGGNREEMQHLVALATQLRFWPALAALCVLVVFGKAVLGLFGDEFVIGYPTLLILALSQVVLAAVGPVDVLLTVTGHQDQCMKVFASALLLTVLLHLLLVPRFGSTGAAVAVFLVQLFWAIWLHALVVRHLAIQPSLLSFKNAFRKAPG